MSPWELAAETIAVKIRWFGLIIGYILVNANPDGGSNQIILNGILSLGLLYAILDTYYSWRGQVFLGSMYQEVAGFQPLFGALAGWYGGYLRRRMAQNVAASRTARSRRR